MSLLMYRGVRCISAAGVAPLGMRARAAYGAAERSHLCLTLLLPAAKFSSLLSAASSLHQARRTLSAGTHFPNQQGTYS